MFNVKVYPFMSVLLRNIKKPRNMQGFSLEPSYYSRGNIHFIIGRAECDDPCGSNPIALYVQVV